MDPQGLSSPDRLPVVSRSPMPPRNSSIPAPTRSSPRGAWLEACTIELRARGPHRLAPPAPPAHRRCSFPRHGGNLAVAPSDLAYHNAPRVFMISCGASGSPESTRTCQLRDARRAYDTSSSLDTIGRYILYGSPRSARGATGMGCRLPSSCSNSRSHRRRRRPKVRSSPCAAEPYRYESARRIAGSRTLDQTVRDTVVRSRWAAFAGSRARDSSSFPQRHPRSRSARSVDASAWIDDVRNTRSICGQFRSMVSSIS